MQKLQDSNVRLPRSVRRQMAQIEAIEQQRKAQSSASTADGTNDDPANGAPGATTGGGEGDVSATPTPQANGAAAGQPGQAQTPAPAPAASEDPRHADPAYWRQRFKVMQGFLDQARLAAAERERQHAAELQRLSDELQQAKQQQRSSTSDEVDVRALFTDAEIEQYGEDQCRAMAKAAVTAAKRQAAAAIEPMQERAQRDEQQRQQREQQADVQAQQTLALAIAEHVPDFQEIDATPGWRAWLQHPDDRTGIVRQELLTGHVQRRDASRIVAMFQAYTAERDAMGDDAAPAPAPAAPRRQPPVQANGGGRPPNGQIPQAAVLSAPTDAEIRDHYKRAKLGKVTEAENAEFEQRLRLLTA